MSGTLAIVRATDGPRIGSMFSGCGGLELGITCALGGRVVWNAENNTSASAILDHRYSGVPNHGDVTGIDWSRVEPVDLLSLGFPCQDVSFAGTKTGLHPGTRSGLWTHAAYAIRQLRPRLVVIENVRGLLSASATSNVEPCAGCLGNDQTRSLRALGAVLGDLADLGYDAQWRGGPASDVGAAHARFRVFITAAPAAAHAEHGDQSERPWSTWRETRQRTSERTEPRRGVGAPALAERGGVYGPAIRRWELIVGRPAPEPSVPGPRTKRHPSPRFYEWMMGLPEGWVTDVPGISASEQLRLLGNGVIPQHATAVLNELLDVRASEVAA